MGMSKTAALAASRGCVTIVRGYQSYTVCGPYRDDRPEGATTSVQTNCWWRAKEIATRWRARIALTLAGMNADDAEDGVWWAYYRGETSAPGIVNAVLNGAPTRHKVVAVA